MVTRSVVVVAVGILCVLVPFTFIAQVQRDPVPLKSWPAPLYWQPNASEGDGRLAVSRISGEPRLASSTADITPKATTPAGALVFVAMTPCRLVDTRSGQGFTSYWGPPSLGAGAYEDLSNSAEHELFDSV